MQAWRRLLLFLVLFVRVALAHTPPPIHGHVIDVAHSLSAAEVSTLDKKLEDYRLKSSHEIAVYVLDSLGGETIEDVAYTTFNEWKLGAKKEDNGVLLVLAISDRKGRIETGKGAGGAITDLQAKYILREKVSPHMKDGHVGMAIDEGTTEIMAALDDPQRGLSLPPPTPPVPTAKPDDAWQGIALFIGGLFALVFFMVFLSIRSTSSSGWATGSSSSWTSGSDSSSSSSSSSSSWSSDSSSSSSSSSSYSSGFSGGGGSSGGGGASDSW